MSGWNPSLVYRNKQETRLLSRREGLTIGVPAMRANGYACGDTLKGLIMQAVEDLAGPDASSSRSAALVLEPDEGVAGGMRAVTYRYG